MSPTQLHAVTTGVQPTWVCAPSRGMCRRKVEGLLPRGETETTCILQKEWQTGSHTENTQSQLQGDGFAAAGSTDNIGPTKPLIHTQKRFRTQGGNQRQRNGESTYKGMQREGPGVHMLVPVGMRGAQQARGRECGRPGVDRC